MALPPAVPQYIAEILRVLNDSGSEAYLVGGCVRDMLLGRAIHDWDIASSVSCEKVQDLFPKTVATGIRYGTITVLCEEGKAEVTTFRADGDYTGHRKPESVRPVSSLQEDLKRRDFTVNAMAMAESGEITDLFGGKEDLQKRVIRCVGEPKRRFEEDALRMLRALRFSAVLGFNVAEDTMKAIFECSGLAACLSAERVRDELRKILLSPRPDMISVLIETGLLQTFLSGESAADADFTVLGAAENREDVRWSLLCRLLQSAGAILSAEQFLKKLRLDNKMISLVCRALAAGENGFPRDKVGLKRKLAELGADAVLCGAKVWDVYGEYGIAEKLEEILASGECCSLRQLAVNGRDLAEIGCGEGAETGRALAYLLEYVLQHPEDNTKPHLLMLAQEYAEKKCNL